MCSQSERMIGQTESCHVGIPCLSEAELSGSMEGKKRWTEGPIIPAGWLLAAGGWSWSSSQKNTISSKDIGVVKHYFITFDGRFQMNKYAINVENNLFCIFFYSQ